MYEFTFLKLIAWAILVFVLTTLAYWPRKSR